MRLVAIALCALSIACGGSKVDKAVDQYINKDFAMTHAKILAARDAYDDIRAVDIDDPGRLESLRFKLRDVAVPFLAQAIEETGKLTPPPAAQFFHDETKALLPIEHRVIAELAGTLEPPDAAAFKAAHAKLMDMAPYTFKWEETRQRMLFQAGVKLAPLPEVQPPGGTTTPPAPK